MRTLHLMESAQSRHTTPGMPSFVSASVHVALVVAALYATTRSAPERASQPDPRVYFVPERPAPVARRVAEVRPSRPRPAPPTRAPAPEKVATPSAVAPVRIPPVEVPLGNPTAQEPVSSPGNDEGVARTDTGGSGGSGAYAVGEVEIPAAPVSKAGPDYPTRAIQLGLSGGVTVRFIVGANGRVEDEVIVLESPGAELTSAVRSFLRSARYRPARVGGRAVRQLVEQRFVFELRR